jgi:hypothetical protein
MASLFTGISRRPDAFAQIVSLSELAGGLSLDEALARRFAS